MDTILRDERGGFKLLRTGDLSRSLTVFYKIKGSGYNGADFRPLSGVATFASGRAAAKVKLVPYKLTQPEPVKVKLRLTPAPDYLVGDPATAKIKISDRHIPSLFQ